MLDTIGWSYTSRADDGVGKVCLSQSDLTTASVEDRVVSFNESLAQGDVPSLCVVKRTYTQINLIRRSIS